MKGIAVCVHGIQRLVEEDRYCIDILNQTSVIQDALTKVEATILEDRLKICIATAIRGDEPGERERVTRELVLLSKGRLSLGRSRDLPSVSLAPALAAPGCGNRPARSGQPWAMTAYGLAKPSCQDESWLQPRDKAHPNRDTPVPKRACRSA